MPNNDSTDNFHVNDATTDSAKIWDGDEYSETTWLNDLSVGEVVLVRVVEDRARLWVLLSPRREGA